MGDSPNPGRCRACCVGDHGEEEACDQCPFEACGEEGGTVLRLYHLASDKHEDPKTKITNFYLNTDRLMFAFDMMSITEKERAFQYVARAVAIMNGDVQHPSWQT